MFKYQNAAIPGDRIRSYDFEGRPDCYIEGKVLRLDITGSEKGYAAFVVMVDNDGWPENADKGSSTVIRDPHTRIGQTVFVPMESLFDWDGRIMNLQERN